VPGVGAGVKSVLHTESSPGWGGQEVRNLTEARWLQEEGWRVLLACRPRSEILRRAEAAGVPARPVPMRGSWDLPSALRLAALVRREGVDLVHTHSSIDAWLGGLAARLAGVPVVRSRHVSIPLRGGWNPVYTLLADRILTSGEAIRRLVVGAGIPPDKVVALPAGVDLALFKGGLGDRVRAELRLTRPVVGSVAMFRGSKGHDVLLEAFERIGREFPRATLLLVGDGIRRAWVESLARERGLGERVRFAGFREDVPDLLAAMDCFVLASIRTEGIPQSLLQAMAAGVPVVASSVGGIPEVIEDGETGRLVPVLDASALAREIRAVLADPATARRRAEAARARVEAGFSRERAMARLAAIYGELGAS
jgi:glycosyltransferase involved in cell wall biosynthesis